MNPPELPEGYYLTNFESLCEFVYARYEDLLTPEERAFRVDFRALEDSAKRLYVRLLMRKGNCFRTEKLSYADVTGLSDALATLANQGFIRPASGEDVTELLEVCTKPEVLNWLASQTAATHFLPKWRSEKKAALVAAVVEWLSAHPTENQSFLSAFPALILQRTEAFDVYKLLYFANLRQDLTEFVLRDLGIYTYVPYPLNRAARFFHTRPQIEAHLAYYALSAELDEEAAKSVERLHEVGERLARLPDTDRLIHRRTVRMGNRLARQLERLGETEKAQACYARLDQHPARERQVRILAQNHHFQAALNLCQTMLAAPWCEEERLFALAFGHRTWTRWQKEAIPDNSASPDDSGLPAGYAACFAKPEKLCSPLVRSLVLPLADSVELAVADHYGDAWYVENSLFNGLLGLAIWDLVFADVPGAFFNPFQVMPLDFNEPDFMVQRDHLWNPLQAKLKEPGHLAELVQRNYQAHYGQVNPLVFWPALTEPLLEMALARIPPPHLLAVFDRLLEDLPNHRSGLPDLIRFPDSGGYELVEVKGPGDRLQNNQARWMHFFARESIPHALVNVVWKEMNG